MIKKLYKLLNNYIKFIQLVVFSDSFKNSLYTNQHILKKYFKILKSIFFIMLITMQMPDALIDYLNELNLEINDTETENKMTDKDKQIIMVCFIFMSVLLSYTLNNYHCEAPRYFPRKPT